MFALALPVASRIQISADISDSLIPSGSEFSIRIDEFGRIFDEDNFQMVVWEGLPCSAEGLRQVFVFERRLQAINGVESVRGLTLPASTVIRELDDEIWTVTFVEYVREHPERSWCSLLRGLPELSAFVSRSSPAIATLFRIRDSDKESAVSAVYDELLTSLESSESAANTSGRLVGEMIISEEVVSVTQSDSSLAIVMPIIGALVIWLVTGSVFLAVHSAFGALVSVSFALAFMQVANLSLSPITSFLLFLVFPLSASMAVHVYGYVQPNLRLASPASAIVFAGLTTAAGFLSTYVSSVPDLRILAVVGSGMIVVLSLYYATLVYPTAKRLSMSGSLGRVRMQARYRFLSSRSAFLGATALSVTVLFLGLPSMQAEYGPSDYLPLSNPVRAEFEHVDAGFGRMSVPIVLRNQDGIFDRQYLEKIQRFIERVEREHEGVRIDWFYPRLRKVAAMLSGSTREAPSTQVLVQAYELFVRSDISVVSEDYRELVLTCQFRYLKSSEYLEFRDDVFRLASENNLEVGSFSGRADVYFEIGHGIAWDVLVGMLIMAFVVFVLFCIYTKSLRTSVVASVVNLISVAIGVGMLGILDIDLELGSAIVLAIVFGIVVDDTAHFVSRFQSVLDKDGDSAHAASLAMTTIAFPMAASTIAIVLCFSVFYFVELKLLTDFSLVVLSVLSSALVIDLVVLPKLLALVHRTRAVR